MKTSAPTLALVLALAVLLAGCTASGEQQDPWAYAKKPLYASGFDLAKVSANGGTSTEEFRVTDGSIGKIRLLVWVNATAGSANVEITDPSGKSMLSTTSTTETSVGLALGAWKVKVDAPEGSAGRVHVLAVRG